MVISGENQFQGKWWTKCQLGAVGGEKPRKQPEVRKWKKYTIQKTLQCNALNALSNGKVNRTYSFGYSSAAFQYGIFRIFLPS